MAVDKDYLIRETEIVRGTLVAGLEQVSLIEFTNVEDSELKIGRTVTELKQAIARVDKVLMYLKQKST